MRTEVVVVCGKGGVWKQEARVREMDRVDEHAETTGGHPPSRFHSLN
jgi:hypothetical protein